MVSDGDAAAIRFGGNGGRRHRFLCKSVRELADRESGGNQTARDLSGTEKAKLPPRGFMKLDRTIRLPAQ
jgi:hypothetical protein